MMSESDLRLWVFLLRGFDTLTQTIEARRRAACAHIPPRIQYLAQEITFVLGSYPDLASTALRTLERSAASVPEYDRCSGL